MAVQIDYWIGTSVFRSARRGTKTFSPDSDHKVLSMTFGVTCDGVRFDEAALIRTLCKEPVEKLKVGMIFKLAKDANFDTFLAGDQGFARASAKLVEVVHGGGNQA